MKVQTPAVRIAPSQAVEMLRCWPTAQLMQWADSVRRRLHGRRTYFVHSLNLNPTNVCRNRCKLCAYWREPDASDAYFLSLDQARERLVAARELRLTDLHIVGGLDDSLTLSYYEELIRISRELLPNAFVQALTAVEIDFLARTEKIASLEVLKRLQAAGLGALPGGGAEIFNQAVREEICANKISAARWLEIHEQAHSLGMPSNATLLFGHLESPADIVDHLDRLRCLQDRTRGFEALVALPFHPAGTRLNAAGPTGDLIARVVAIARIYLDNVPHVRVLANYMDRKLLGALTHGGADDVGGTSLDERIAKAAGGATDELFACLTEMDDFLRSLRLTPVLVNSRYEEQTRRDSGNPAETERQPIACTLALGAARAGERLSAEQAVTLYESAPMAELGALAHACRQRIHPEPAVTFVVDRNINFTNVCRAGCHFCAFHVAPGEAGAYVLSIPQIVEKVVEAERLGATQVLLQGGLNPELGLEFFEEMLRAVKRHSSLWVHSLSPAEVQFAADHAGLSIRECLERLRAAGLDSLPGGGAEILVDDVRRRVSPNKISAEDWLAVMAEAHGLGMKTTATMVYGLGETPAQKIEHLIRVRELQDRTGGFTAFIPWSFQPNRTRVKLRAANGVEYLRMVALSRLVLDNVPHIQAGWVTEGASMAQLALSFGADDFGGVLMEEHVVRSTGVQHTLTRDQVTRLIHEAGFDAAQRTTQYEIVCRHPKMVQKCAGA